MFLCCLSPHVRKGRHDGAPGMATHGGQSVSSAERTNPNNEGILSFALGNSPLHTYMQVLQDRKT